MPLFKAIYHYGDSGATVEELIDSDTYFTALEFAKQLLNEEYITIETDDQIVAVPTSSIEKIAVNKSLSDGTPYVLDRTFEDFISNVSEIVQIAKPTEQWANQFHPVLHNFVETSREIIHKVANPDMARNYDVQNPPLPAWVPAPPVDPTLD